MSAIEFATEFTGSGTLVIPPSRRMLRFLAHFLTERVQRRLSFCKLVFGSVNDQPALHIRGSGPGWREDQTRSWRTRRDVSDADEATPGGYFAAATGSLQAGSPSREPLMRRTAI
jgi:hypothetical protein